MRPPHGYRRTLTIEHQSSADPAASFLPVCACFCVCVCVLRIRAALYKHEEVSSHETTYCTRNTTIKVNGGMLDDFVWIPRPISSNGFPHVQSCESVNRATCEWRQQGWPLNKTHSWNRQLRLSLQTFKDIEALFKPIALSFMLITMPFCCLMSLRPIRIYQ